MWRLNAFWKVICPDPVTLNRFLALLLVLTFGMFITCYVTPCWRSEQTETYGALWEMPENVVFGDAKLDILFEYLKNYRCFLNDSRYPTGINWQKR
jgi:hypothetical protein